MIGMLRLPQEIHFGFGVRVGIPAAAAALGRRAFVVVDPVLARTPAFTDLVRELESTGIEVALHTDIPPELPVASVESAGARARDYSPDVVIGYGGGSALDASKLIALLSAFDAPLSNFYGENAVPGPVPPVIAVPTTAGTGSEVTPVAVVSDPARTLKVGVSSPHLIPRLAFVDPELTLAAPPGVSVHAGIDAFVHAVESFTARPLPHAGSEPLPVFIGRNALSDPLSLEAARLIFSALPAVVADPADRDARAAMARGSLLAGMAFGSTGTHLSHAIQYPVGAMTKTPHGLGTGTLLPYVLQAVLPTSMDRLIALGTAVGVRAHDDTAPAVVAAQRVVDAVADMCARVGIPASLAEIGVQASDASEIVELTLNVGRLVAISPVGGDAATIRRIVDAAIAGDRSLLIAPTEEDER